MAKDEWESLGDVVGSSVSKDQAVSTSKDDEWSVIGDVVKDAPAPVPTFKGELPAGKSGRPETPPAPAAMEQDNSSAMGDLAAGWELLKQTTAANRFVGADAALKDARPQEGFVPKYPGDLPREVLEQAQTQAVADIAASGAAAAAYPESPAATRFNNSKTFTEAWHNFLAAPYAVSRSTSLRSLGPSMPSIVGGIVGSAAGPLGAAALAGSGSAWAEFGSDIADGLQQKGADLSDPASVMAVWQKFGPEIAQKARVRAGIIGAVDAGTAGIGSKIAATPGMGTVKKELLGIATQMLGGSGGEAGAQIATDGGITQPGAVFGEALGEAVQGGIEQGGQIGIHALKSAAGKTDSELPSMPEAPPEQAAAPGKTDRPPPGTAPRAPGAAFPSDVFEPAPPRTPPAPPPPAPGAAPMAPKDFSELGNEVSRRPGGVNTKPTEGQKKAGNYKKGHVNVQGLDITLENPKGTDRTGKAPDGKDWSVTMPADYGYVKRTTGADGDQVDVFVGDDREAPQVYVIDQIDPDTGKFDEHKAVMGVRSEDEAAKLYHDSFSDGRGVDRIGHITTMPVAEFKDWARNGDTSKPLRETRKPAPAPAQAEAGQASPAKSGAPAPGTAKPAPRAPKAPETASAPETAGSDVVTAPATPAKGIARRDVADDEAITSTGRKVPVKYAVVEAADLIPSQTDEGGANPAYPAELQPRDRERNVSATQVHDIATRLEPKLLDKSPKASDGAPIVSEDGVVESGNGRTLAVRRAYSRGMPSAQKYRDHLAAQGYPVDGMKEPVLVRVRQGEMSPEDRQAFTREANERDTLALSSTERAMADANALTDGHLELFRGGEIDDAGNREFVKAFMRDVVSKNDRANMVDDEGRISQDAVRRIGAALLAKAYGDADLIANLTESTDTSIKGIGGALMDVAGAWSQMVAEAKAGKILADVDQTEALLEAVRMVDRSRREGKPLASLVGQNDIFTGKGMSIEAEAFLRLMFRDSKNWRQPMSRDKLADSLRFYVTEGRKTFEGTDLLGETSPRAKDILATATRKQGDVTAAKEDQGRLHLARPPRGAEPARQDTGTPGGGGKGTSVGGEQAQAGAEAPAAEALGPPDPNATNKFDPSRKPDRDLIKEDIQQRERARRNAMGTTALEDDMAPAAQKKLAEWFKKRNAARDLRHIREAMEVYQRLLDMDTEEATKQAKAQLKAANGFFNLETPEAAAKLQDATWKGLQIITGEEDPDPAELLENEVFATSGDAGHLIFDTLDPKTASFDVEEYNTAFGEVEFRRDQAKVFPKPEKQVRAWKDVEGKVIPQEEADARIAAWKAYAKRVGKEEDHSQETILSLFDVTGQWSQPYVDAGYNVKRFDIKKGDDLMNFPEWMSFIEEEIAEGRTIVGILAAPPCTSFAVSGTRWWPTQHDIKDTSMVAKKYGLWAAKYFDTPLDYANTLVAVTKLIVEQANPELFYVAENPIGRIREQNGLPEPTLTFDPHNYGNPYTKRTQLWGEFNTALPTANVEPTQGSLIHKLRGDVEEDKAKRSETPEGLAYAFFVANNTSKLKLAESRKTESAPAVQKPQEEKTPQEVWQSFTPRGRADALRQVYGKDFTKDTNGPHFKTWDKLTDGMRADLENYFEKGEKARNDTPTPAAEPPKQVDAATVKTLADRADRTFYNADIVKTADGRFNFKGGYEVQGLAGGSLSGVLEGYGTAEEAETAATTQIVDKLQRGADNPSADGQTRKRVDKLLAKLPQAATKIDKKIDQPQVEPEAPPQAVETPQDAPSKPGEKINTGPIEDFGEKIYGARKDMVTEYAKSLGDEADLVKEPLSKTFPVPNYTKLAAAGVSKRALAYVALFRNEIPNRPKLPGRARAWGEKVKLLRNFSHSLLTDETYLPQLEQKMAGEFASLRKLQNMARVMEGMDPELFPFAAQWGLAGSQVSMLNGERFNPPKYLYVLDDHRSRWTNVHGEKVDDVLDPARALIKATYEKENATTSARRTPLFLFNDRKAKTVFIGFKGLGGNIIRLKTDFADVKAARLYMQEHADALQEQVDAMREGPVLRRAANMPRVGGAHRKGDVTPQIFSETFGFRGVQFGNYVEGDRRQSDLNESFDALMDLAAVLGIPPRALSLNGRLGLAFGARGHGGKNAAAAHYEPGQVVINLTKHGGPGSLAHEWLHALDNYFGKQAEGGFMSEGRKPGDVRQAVFDAWKGIEKVLKTGGFAERSVELDKARSKPYFSTTIEKAARSFERYVVDRMAAKEETNDYLANINMEGGAYPTESEMNGEGIREAWDKLFNTIETTKDEATGNMVLGMARRANPRAAEQAALPWKRAIQTALQGFGYKIVDTGLPFGYTDRWGKFWSFGTQIIDKAFPGSDIGKWMDSGWKADPAIASYIREHMTAPWAHRVWFGHDPLANIAGVIDKFGVSSLPEWFGQLFKDSLTKAGIPLPGTQWLVQSGLVGDRFATAWMSMNIGEALSGGLSILGTYRLYKQTRNGQPINRGWAVAGILFKTVGGVLSANPVVLLSAAADTVILAKANRASINEAMSKSGASADIMGMAAAPPFYSALGRTVEGLKMAKAPAAQWLATLKNQQGVKQEELDWIGLADWLNAQPGAVTKEALADFIRANQVQVQEVVKDEKFKPYFQVVGAFPARFDTREEAEDYIKRYTESIQNGPMYAPLRADLERYPFSIVEQSETLAGSPKFSQYQLPGGQNYRELLLTLPDKEPPKQVNQKEIEASDRIAVFNRRMREKYGATWMALLSRDEKLEQERLEDELNDAEIGFEPITELPEGWHSIVDQNAPANRQWGVIPAGQQHARYYNDQGFPSEAEAVAEAIAHYNVMGRLKARDALKKRQEEEKNRGFRAGHWDEPNILAHVRFNEREVDGKRVLFLEEIQSDWHQQGRKRGYKTTVARLRRTEQKVALADAPKEVQQQIAQQFPDRPDLPLWKPIKDVYLYDGGKRWIVEEAADDITLAEWAAEAGALPDAPFKTTWPELALKRMIRWAAENGFDSIAWTPGDVQADRYNLAKHLSKIDVVNRLAGGQRKWWPVTRGGKLMGSITTDQNGKILQAHADYGAVVGKGIDEVFGKDVAEKGLSFTGREYTIEGLDLSVGGEGMKSFYDKMLVDTANKLGKKFGAKVGQGNYPETVKKTLTGFGPTQRGFTFHTLPITPDMRRAALGGFPMFSAQRSDVQATPEQLKKASAELQRISQQILQRRVHVGMVDRFADFIPKEYVALYDRETKTVLLSMKAASELANAAGHEALHALRHIGAITENEWTALRAAARKWGYRRMVETQMGAIYAKAYKEDWGLNDTQFEDMMDEEAVAYMFGDYVAARENVTGYVRRIMDKIKQWAAAVVDLMAREGISARTVMRDAYMGKLASRAAPLARDVLPAKARMLSAGRIYGMAESSAQPLGPDGLVSASGNQPFKDSLQGHAKALGDFLKGVSVSAKLGSKVNIPSSVMTHVLSMVQDEKVFRSVVRLLPVDVVNFLSRKEITPEQLLRDKSMLKDVLTSDGTTTVTSSINEPIALSLLRAIASNAAEVSGLTGGALEDIAAIETGTGDTVLGAHAMNDVTKTEAFSRWFGDSKVVDESGKPLVVYHGTLSGEIDVFHEGTHFGTSKAASERLQELQKFGDANRGPMHPSVEEEQPNVLPVYLSIKNPFITYDLGDWSGPEWADAMKQAGIASSTGPLGEITKFKFARQDILAVERGDEDAINVLAALGFDGIQYKNGYEDQGSTSWVPFSPEQVKSIHNPGTFDRGNPSIMGMVTPADGGAGGRTPPPSGVAVDAKAQEELDDLAGNIRLSRLNTPDDIKDMLKDVADKAQGFMGERRGVVSNEQTAALAAELGMTVKELLNRDTGTAFNAHQIFAARGMLLASAERVKRLAKTAKSSASLADLAEFQKAVLRHEAIQEQVSGMTAEAGRALQQFNMLATKDYLRGIEAVMSHVKDKRASRVSVAKGPEAEARELAEMIDGLQDPAQLGKFVKDMRKVTAWDMLRELWINALLSGPRTHAANILSNTLTALWQVPENFVAEQIGRLHGGDKVQAGETAARVVGLIEGAKEGIVAAGHQIRHGEPMDVISKAEMIERKAIPGKAGEVVRFPGRLLEAEDQFFKAINYRAEINALAVRMALKEGLKGQSLANRIAELRANPTKRMENLAHQAALYQTFQNKLGPIGRGIMNLREAIPLGWVIVPFIRTPANILKYAAERTPLGLAMKPVRDNLMGKNGNVARDTQMARLFLGTAVMTAVVAGVLAGGITGGGPDDPDEQRMLRETGWQPYSIKVGDTYYSYQRMDPLALVVGLAADAVEISQHLTDEEYDKIAYQLVKAVSDNIKEKTWISGLVSFQDAFFSGEAYKLDAWVNRLAGSVVPAAVAQYTQAEDPYIRDARSMLDVIKSRVPGWSSTLIAKRNLFGEQIKRGGALGPDMVSPIFTSTVKDNPLAAELVRLRFYPEMPQRVLAGHKLTPEQYDRYVELSGKDATAKLNRRIALPGWQRLPDDKKEEAIREVFTEARKLARGKLRGEWPELRKPAPRE